MADELFQYQEDEQFIKDLKTHVIKHKELLDRLAAN
jgi:hypothetical protein